MHEFREKLAVYLIKELYNTRGKTKIYIYIYTHIIYPLNRISENCLGNETRIQRLTLVK